MCVLPRKWQYIATAGLLGSVFAQADPCAAETYEVYFLGGQSNMVGYGVNQELPDELKEPIPNVFIFHGGDKPDGVSGGGDGRWAALRPGHGVGFKVEDRQNVYGERFGVELSFVQRLKNRRPNAHIALIKFARGGTSIDAAAAGHFGCWDPDPNFKKRPNQYDNCLATFRTALAVGDLDSDGTDDTLSPAGIIWMQGEADAYHSEATARAYAANLTKLMELLRDALRDKQLPVVIGRISDSGQDTDGTMWDYGNIVRAAQAEFVQNDGRAALVTSTDKYGYCDPYHYDTAGYLDLGAKFADALCNLIEGKP